MIRLAWGGRKPGESSCGRTVVRHCVSALSAACLVAVCAVAQPNYSGIYPHLAVFLDDGECGIGAVVPWAGKLWAVTYPPHDPSTDGGPYSIGSDLTLNVPGDPGGTHASRMIHKETNQLIIGPHVIDSLGNVRTITGMSARLTGVARHLFEPATKVYFMGMEEEFYEADLTTMTATAIAKPDFPGAHAKGAYTSQGLFVFSNNGRGGGLYTWDGTVWDTVMLAKHTEVTGPGGIYGAPNDTTVLWATGWDEQSVILHALDHGQWHRYRLPKAGYTYDPDNGWFTEWPRIRQVDGGPMLMTMHGAFFNFPSGFNASNTAGIRPINSYLKIIADFTEWNGELVMACDDLSKFHDKNIGLSQSNFLFTTVDKLREWGPAYGNGGPWVAQRLYSPTTSDPYLAAGYQDRCIHLAVQGGGTTIEIEHDALGDGQWQTYGTYTLPTDGYHYELLPASFSSEWIRFKTSSGARVTAYANYTDAPRAEDPTMGTALTKIEEPQAWSGGALIVRDDKLYFVGYEMDENDSILSKGFYEMDKTMTLRPLENPTLPAGFESSEMPALDYQITPRGAVLEAGALVLPRSSTVYDGQWGGLWPRGKRLVVTERFLWNVHGTFYEVPEALNDLDQMRPITTHNRKILDYSSYLGMLVLAGVDKSVDGDRHVVTSTDGKVSLWCGNIDDLWKLGPPNGAGGPLLETPVAAGEISSAFLMGGYDQKKLSLSHDAASSVTFDILVDPVGDLIPERYFTYASIAVPAGQTVVHEFPDGYNAQVVRIKARSACTATAWFEYGSDPVEARPGHRARSVRGGAPFAHIRVRPNDAAVTLAHSRPYRIDLYGLDGRRVWTHAGTEAGTIRLPLARLAAGSYLVKVESDGESIRRMFPAMGTANPAAHR